MTGVEQNHERREHIERLKQAADPAQVAEALGMKSKGKRFFCPACQPRGGKTPDLSITDSGFHCFKCGLKGDLLQLIMEYGPAGITFPEAIEILESMTGIQAPGTNARQKGRKRAVKRRTPEKAYNTTKQLERRHGPSDAVPAVNTATPEVLEAFLNACDPLEGAALEWAEEKGVPASLAETLRLRFCGRRYRDIMEQMKGRFTVEDMTAAGLLKLSRGRAVPTFWHYYASKAGFIVIPYLLDGRPVYLKTRPPCSKEIAENHNLSRFLNTPGPIPCLYNADALKTEPKAERVFICEGESDTWAAMAAGYAAVGSPGAKAFKPEWVELFREFVEPIRSDRFEERAGIRQFEAGMNKDEAERFALEEADERDKRSAVFMVPDNDEAGREGARKIAEMFRRAGLLIPRRLTLPDGKDLADYLKKTG